MKNNIWKILIYFIIYSIFGFFLETVYAIITKGMLESRKSFLYGPFCIVYGIAGICLVFVLKKYKGKNWKLFFGGMFVGAIIEYLTSYIGEKVLHAKWWDYSDSFLNINGRTCLYYAIWWGVLSILLINYIHPFFDKRIDFVIKKVPQNFIKFVTFSIIFLMCIDCGLTCYVLNEFLNRVAVEYNINIDGIKGKNEENLISKIYPNEKMMMIYPNIIVEDKNGNNIYLGSVLSNIKNYYYKF